MRKEATIGILAAFVALILTSAWDHHYMTSNTVIEQRTYKYFGEGDQGTELAYWITTGDTSIAFEWTDPEFYNKPDTTIVHDTGEIDYAIDPNYIYQQETSDSGIEVIAYPKHSWAMIRLTGDSTVTASPPSNREYQVEITESGSVIYDGNRTVGVLAFDKNSAFDKLMLKDNQ